MSCDYNRAINYYDYWATFAEEQGIPDDEIDKVLESAEICGCSISEGPCVENTAAIIRSAAKEEGK